MRDAHHGPAEGANRRRRTAASSCTRCCATSARSSACSPKGMFETGVRRIGAEQEMFLSIAAWRPAPGRARAPRRRSTTRTSRPSSARSTSRSTSTRSSSAATASAGWRPSSTSCSTGARRAPTRWASSVVLTGHPADDPQVATSASRTWCRARATWRSTRRITRPARAASYEFYIKGLDELRMRHDSVMVEACNASFQVHLQVEPDEFANLYNIAQVLAGPVLAVRHQLAAALRPPAVGRDPHRAVPAGGRHPPARAITSASASPRVTFGDRWVAELGRSRSTGRTSRGSARSSPPTLDEDPFDVLGRGRGARPEGAAPAQRHDLPLEPRLLRHHRRQAAPAHREPRPAVRAELARRGRQRRVLARADGGARPIATRTSPRTIEFEQAKRELLRRRAPGPRRATRLARRRASCRRPALALEHLLPLAARGARRRWASTTPTASATSASSSAACAPGNTGSRWLLQSLAEMRGRGTPGQRLNSLTAATVARQRAERPVAEWTLARLDEGGGWRAQLPARRAVHDDRPRTPSTRTTRCRARRQPDGLAPHPPGAGRGRPRAPGRPRLVPGAAEAAGPRPGRPGLDRGRGRDDA